MSTNALAPSMTMLVKAWQCASADMSKREGTRLNTKEDKLEREAKGARSTITNMPPRLDSCEQVKDKVDKFVKLARPKRHKSCGAPCNTSSQRLVHKAMDKRSIAP
jgi:hypothetical protein